MSKRARSSSPPNNPVSSLTALSSKRARYSTPERTRSYSPPVNPQISRGGFRQRRLRHLTREGSIARQLPICRPLNRERYIDQGLALSSHGSTSVHQRSLADGPIQVRPSSTNGERDTHGAVGTFQLSGYQGFVTDGQTQVSRASSSRGIRHAAGNVDVEYGLEEMLDEGSSGGESSEENGTDGESSDGEFSEENGTDGDVSDLSGSDGWTVVDDDEEWNALSNDEE